MTENSSRRVRQALQVGRTVKIVAIEDQESIRAKVLPTTSQGIPGATRFDLTHHLTGGNMGLALQVGFDLVREVIHDNQHAVDAAGQCTQSPVENGTTLER
jgi:hypothetical protein